MPIGCSEPSASPVRNMHLLTMAWNAVDPIENDEKKQSFAVPLAVAGRILFDAPGGVERPRPNPCQARRRASGRDRPKPQMRRPRTVRPPIFMPSLANIYEEQAIASGSRSLCNMRLRSIKRRSMPILHSAQLE